MALAKRRNGAEAKLNGLHDHTKRSESLRIRDFNCLFYVRKKTAFLQPRS
jgi:hypothetical protein